MRGKSATAHIAIQAFTAATCATMTTNALSFPAVRASINLADHNPRLTPHTPTEKTPGTPLEISVENGRVILQPQRQKYSLEALLEGITDDNLHAETDWGADVGKEKWVYDEPEP